MKWAIIAEIDKKEAFRAAASLKKWKNVKKVTDLVNEIANASKTINTFWIYTILL